MCLIRDKSLALNQTEAWKVVSVEPNHLSSIYFKYAWSPGSHSTEVDPDNTAKRVYRGFHAYLTRPQAEYMLLIERRYTTKTLVILRLVVSHENLLAIGHDFSDMRTAAFSKVEVTEEDYYGVFRCAY